MRSPALAPLFVAPLLLGLAVGCAPPTQPPAAAAQPAPPDQASTPAPVPSDAANEFAARRAAGLAPAEAAAAPQYDSTLRGGADLELAPVPTQAAPVFRAQ